MYITDQIGYPFLKILVFEICFVSYEYCILVFALFRKVMDTHKFWFESRRITN